MLILRNNFYFAAFPRWLRMYVTHVLVDDGWSVTIDGLEFFWSGNETTMLHSLICET